MIFVTLGTQKQQFIRLLKYIEKSNIKENIIVQNGNTKYESNKFKMIGFISYYDMQNYIQKCNYIISHGGLSIIDALKANKKVICCPRKKEFKEHINNHQEEMNKYLADNGYILLCNNQEEFDNCINKINNFNPKKFIYDDSILIRFVEKEIDKYLN